MAEQVTDGLAVLIDDLNAELTRKKDHGALEFPLIVMMNGVAQKVGRPGRVVIDVEFPGDGEVSMVFRFRRLNWLTRFALWTCEPVKGWARK